MSATGTGTAPSSVTAEPTPKEKATKPGHLSVQRQENTTGTIIIANLAQKKKSVIKLAMKNAIKKQFETNVNKLLMKSDDGAWGKIYTGVTSLPTLERSTDDNLTWGRSNALTSDRKG
eukprot:4213019-Amphidinium_carterae.1